MAHRGSHDYILPCDWFATLHRGSLWLKVTIFSNNCIILCTLTVAFHGCDCSFEFTTVFRTYSAQFGTLSVNSIVQCYLDNYTIEQGIYFGSFSCFWTRIHIDMSKIRKDMIQIFCFRPIFAVYQIINIYISKSRKYLI